MSKRYEEPITVEAPEGAIEAFWWRGKRYLVRQVLCRWREAGGWWDRPGEAQKPWAGVETCEILRIEATATANGLAPGIYEISRDLRKGEWTLFRVWD